MNYWPRIIVNVYCSPYRPWAVRYTVLVEEEMGVANDINLLMVHLNQLNKCAWLIFLKTFSSVVEECCRHCVFKYSADLGICLS